MGSMFKAGTQKSSSESSSNPWEPATGDLKTILAEMGNWYDSAKDTGYISSTGDLGSIYSQYLSGLSGLSQQAQNGTNSLTEGAVNGANSALSGYTNAATGGLNYSTQDILNGARGLYNNDMVQTQIDAANKGIQQNLAEQVFTGIDREAIGSGNMGSSRAGVAQAIAARDATQMMTDNANNITANAYQNALNTSANTLSNNVATQMGGLSGASNAANNMFGMAGNYANTLMSGLNPTLTGATLNQDIQASNQADQIGQRDFIANLLSQYYTPTATAIGGMGGTTTGTQKTPGSSMFNSLLSAGSAAGSIYSSFSDVRLKKNIHKAGVENGYQMYTWEWTDEAKALVGDQSTYGVIAQEVMITNPKAVHMDASGYLKVDYSQLKG